MRQKYTFLGLLHNLLKDMYSYNLYWNYDMVRISRIHSRDISEVRYTYPNEMRIDVSLYKLSCKV